MDKQELQVAIEADKQKRGKAFQAAINAAMDKYNCELQPVCIIRGGQVETTIEVIVK